MQAKPRATVLKLVVTCLLPMTLTSQCMSNGSPRAADLLRAQLADDWT
jgi:hypothetical protein